MKLFNFKEDLLNKAGLYRQILMTGTCLISMFLFSSCGDDNLSAEKFEVYEGPLSVVEKMELTFSDSAKTKVKLMAKKQLDFANGDREFPEGVYLEFYADNEILETTLQANSGYVNKETNIYTVLGDVKINNIVQVKSLFTEELHWNPAKEQIYTDKNVIIVQDGERITGTGLVASQNFETYEIMNPRGSVPIEEDIEAN